MFSTLLFFKNFDGIQIELLNSEMGTEDGKYDIKLHVITIKKKDMNRTRHYFLSMKYRFISFYD